MATSFPYPYFLDENSGKIFRHPVIDEEGEIFEKREFKKSYPDKKYIDNKSLKKQIDKFLENNPEYVSNVYKSDKGGIERIEELVKGIDGKSFRNLQKCKVFSLQEFNDPLIVGMLKKFNYEETVYVLENLLPHDLKNFGCNILNTVWNLRKVIFSSIFWKMRKISI